MTGRSAGFAWLALAFAAIKAPAFQAPSTPPASPDEPTPRLIPRTPAEREQRFVDQHRVILNVRVADATGKPISELSQGDFTLYDNDQPRKLVSFRSVGGATGGAHIIFVIDGVNNFTKQIRNYAKEIERYLKERDGPLAYPVALGVFSGITVEVGQPSRDRAALLGELRTRAGDLHAAGCITELDHGNTTAAAYTLGGMGGTRAQSQQELMCKNDRFVKSVSALTELARKQKDVPGRAILVWLGPGWPMLTDKGFTPDPPDLKRNFFGRLVSLSMLLREAQMTVNAVASPDESINPQTPNVRDTEFFVGVSSPDQVGAANFGLHVLAHQTGGRIFSETRDVAGQISACVADAESYYVLTFDTPPAANFGEFHALAVKVNKPGLDVRTNTHYYGEQ
jgi:VWFA-related protein